MKKIIITFAIILLFCSCSTTIVFNPCISNKSQEELESFIIPVKVGNKWVYKFKEKNIVKKVTYTITGFEEIYYNDLNGKKTLKAYKIQDDSDKNLSCSYYYKCDSSVQLFIVDSPKNKQLTDLYQFFDDPHIGSEENMGENNKIINHLDYIWKEPVNIVVPAGTFSCYLKEMYYKAINDRDYNLQNNKKKIHSQNYYCKGVGLVKIINYDKFGNILSTYELESYKIN